MDEDGLIELSFNSNLSRYCNGFFKRIKYAFKILLFGRLNMYGSTLMNANQIDDFIEALQKVRLYRKTKNEN